MTTPPLNPNPNPNSSAPVPPNPVPGYESPYAQAPYAGAQPPAHPPAASTPVVPKARIGTKARVARIRVVWATVMLLALAAVYFNTAPEGPDASAASGWEAQQTLASGNNDLNNENTQGAPQQSVVNGWYANDLLDLQVTQAGSLYEAQLYEAAVSRRNGDLLALLGLAVLGDLLLQAVGRSGRPTRPEAASVRVQ